MSRSPRVARILSIVALSYSLALLPTLGAADDPPVSSAPKSLGDQKPIDWSNYTFVADAIGEVVKADSAKVTIRVTWFVDQVQANKYGNRRPPLHHNNRNFRNPFANNMNRPKIVHKEMHHDYELEFVPESLVRTKTIPTKLDEKGVRVNLNQKELDEFRAPAGAPWYAASPADLVPGTIVDFIVIHDKKIPNAKVTENDLRLKYVVILGKDPHPPKDIASGAAKAATPPAKKN